MGPAPTSANRWMPLLESILSCPACGGALDLQADPRCTACDYRGRTTEGFPDFVDEAGLASSHHAEVAAQTRAVDAYYENESRLTCHWDRISADDIPERLGHPTGVALDLGCGTGTAGGALKRSGMQVVGADLSPPCLVAAARRLDAVVRVDAAKLPFKDASFDALVARGALHHMHDPDRVMVEVKRILKPGAPALFLDPREFSWLEPIKDALRVGDDSFTHDHHAYEPDDYRALIERHLNVENTWTEHPFGILIAHGLDLLPIPKIVPRRPLTSALLGLDRKLNNTPLSRLGHLLVVSARRA